MTRAYKSEGGIPARSRAPVTAPIDVPTMTYASRASHPASASAASVPAWNECPTGPPAPRTSPTRRASFTKLCIRTPGTLDRRAMSHPRAEIEETLGRYVAMREQIDAGNGTWTDLLQFFTDDVVYIDPAWGRIEGIDAVRTFMVDSMAGLDDWKFPIEFMAIEGDDVVVKWTEVIPKPDGTAATQSGYSRLIYAGEGKFSYEEDLLNMVHVLDDIANSGWRPTGPMNVPPKHPNRDVSISAP
ncbi:MAG: nuclear transport factor 2 family protein [Actinobacteria bacterium]|nr:MAG: nuclear transport factor 2 family protein [Actinomycetota bacterium]